jgi:GT2 family glycosyltransferase
MLRRNTYASGKSLSIGVVVPCHNSSRQLYGVLSALASQSSRPETVVVVDDNSDPAEELRSRTICGRFAANYQRLPPPRTASEALGRRSHARNAGTRVLNSDVILYLDGDMLLGPRYVEEIKHYHAALERVYIRGQRFCISTALQSMGMETCLNEVAKLRSSGQNTPPSYIADSPDFERETAYNEASYDKWEWCASNNLSVRKEYVSQIHYWDENFVGWGEEDMDFSFRLYRSGLTPIFLASDAAASYHLEHRVDHKMNACTLATNAKYLLRKFPEVAALRMEAYARFGINADDFRD